MAISLRLAASNFRMGLFFFITGPIRSLRETLDCLMRAPQVWSTFFDASHARIRGPENCAGQPALRVQQPAEARDYGVAEKPVVEGARLAFFNRLSSDCTAAQAFWSFFVV